jgi:GNAT superfamily N-acetyltransferase
MSNVNQSWQEVSSGYEQPEEEYFREWIFFEQKFGEFGTPGFTELIVPARFPDIFGHNDNHDVRFTLYRGEDGLLLFVHGCWINEDNVQKPFIWNAHPEYRRQGIGTMMANYIIERYKTENGEDFPYQESIQNGKKFNAATANFANKFIPNIQANNQ